MCLSVLRKRTEEDVMCRRGYLVQRGKTSLMKYKPKDAKMNGLHPKLGRGKAWVSPEPQKDHGPARALILNFQP